MNRKDADTARRLGPSAWRDDWMTTKETLMDEPKLCSQCGEPFAARACGPTHAIVGAQRASQAAVGLDQLAKLADQAIADHSVCVNEDCPDERIIPPSLRWFVEDYLPAALADGAAARASRAATATHSPGGDAGAARDPHKPAEALSGIQGQLIALGRHLLLRRSTTLHRDELVDQAMLDVSGALARIAQHDLPAVIPAIRAAVADEIERIIGIDPPIDDQDQDIRNVVRHLRGLCTICGQASDAEPCGHAHAINLRGDQ